MSDTDKVLTIKVDGVEYEFPTESAELGDLRVVKNEYGVTDVNNTRDPNQVAAMVYLAMRRRHSDLSSAELVARIDKVRHVEFITPDEPEADPTPAGDDPAPAPVLDGSQGTTPEGSGPPA